MPFQQIHLTDLNESLADSFLKYKSGFEVDIKNCTPDGYISIDVKNSNHKFTDDNIDFDLSVCECSGLFESSYSEFLNKSVYTASPYEFTEFLLLNLSSVTMLVSMIEGSWVVQILDYQVSE